MKRAVGQNENKGRFLAPRAPLDGVPVRPNEIATTLALRVAGGNTNGLAYASATKVAGG